MVPPPFSLERTKYDMSTLWGRTRYWAEAINPALLLCNERTLQKDQLLLDAYKSGQSPPSVSDAELWRARRSVEQCIHPTSQQVIFPLFRMSMFLPMNFFVVPFMMMPATVSSVGRTLAIQWFNQSYNCAVNYANRSSDEQPMAELAKAYAAAVTVACGGSLGATMMLKKVPAGTVQASLIRATVPFLAVSAAAVVNLASMRKNEWRSSGEGIRVKDEDGTVRGMSTAAGWDSLQKCSATRLIWNLPCMVLPTLLMVPLTQRSALCKAYALPLEMMLQCLGLSLGVPPALGAYALTQTMAAEALEPQFQNLKRLNGEPVKMFTYYKGL